MYVYRNRLAKSFPALNSHNPFFGEKREYWEIEGKKRIYEWNYTGCPTRYRTRQFFNNFTTNEDIATKFEADLPHCVRYVATTNVLLFKFRCNIFIGVRIIKEMPGSVASGTLCILDLPCFTIAMSPSWRNAENARHWPEFIHEPYDVSSSTICHIVVAALCQCPTRLL